MITFKTNVKEFNKSIEKFQKKAAGISTEKVIKKIAFDLMGCIIGGLPGKEHFGLESITKGGKKSYKQPTVTGRHPVDLGRARAGWYASMNGLLPSAAGTFNWAKGVKKDVPGAINKGIKEGSFKDGLSGFGKYVELINGVDYIVFLEYGYSAQAPAGMVRIAIQKMKGQMPNLINDEYVANWNSAGL